MKIGHQLYSVRELCRTPEALEATLGKISQIGYRYVQLSGICACEPEFLKAALEENGLRAVICHADFRAMRDDPEALVSYYEKVGCENIGIGSMPDSFRGSAEGYDAFIRELGPMLDVMRGRSKQLYYHNHAFDLKKLDDGSCILSRLAQDERFSLLLDTYWLHMGGYDEAAVIRKTSGRCNIIHFKDWELDDNTPRFAPILRGNLNWDAIYSACIDTGVEYAFVEQDTAYDGETPLECAQISFCNMKNAGWIE